MNKIIEIIGKNILILAAFTTLILNIRKIISWFRKIILKAQQYLTRYRPELPKETLKLIAIPNHCWWSMGSSGGKPAIQVVGDWYVTNITDQAIKICGARVKTPRIDGFMTVRHPNKDIYGDYYIPPKYTTDGRVLFCIQPPINKIDKPLILDLDFIDQYGNVHRVKKVRFNPPKNKESIEKPQEKKEKMNNKLTQLFDSLLSIRKKGTVLIFEKVN